MLAKKLGPPPILLLKENANVDITATGGKNFLNQYYS
jgi:hypothetical protein